MRIPNWVWMFSCFAFIAAIALSFLASTGGGGHQNQAGPHHYQQHYHGNLGKTNTVDLASLPSLVPFSDHTVEDIIGFQKEARKGIEVLLNTQVEITLYGWHLEEVSKIVNAKMTADTEKDWRVISKIIQSVAGRYQAIGHSISRTARLFKRWTGTIRGNDSLPRTNETAVQLWKRLRETMNHLHERLLHTQEAHQKTIEEIDTAFEMSSRLCLNLTNTTRTYEQLLAEARNGWTLKKYLYYYGSGIACVLPGKFIADISGMKILMASEVMAPLSPVAFGVLGVTTVAGYHVYDYFITGKEKQEDYLTMLDLADMAAKAVKLGKDFLRNMGSTLHSIIALTNQARQDVESYQQNALRSYLNDVRDTIAEIVQLHETILHPIPVYINKE